jgi:hypothetical protein
LVETIVIFLRRRGECPFAETVIVFLRRLGQCPFVELLVASRGVVVSISTLVKLDFMFDHLTMHVW